MTTPQTIGVFALLIAAIVTLNIWSRRNNFRRWIVSRFSVYRQDGGDASITVNQYLSISKTDGSLHWFSDRSCATRMSRVEAATLRELFHPPPNMITAAKDGYTYQAEKA